MHNSSFEIRHILLAITSGLLLGLSAYPAFSGLILFVAFIPILYIDHSLNKSSQSPTNLIFFVYSLITTLTWHITALWWINVVTITVGMSFIIYNSLIYAIIITSLHYFHKNFSDNFAYTAFTFLWLAFEYINHNWAFAFPFLSLGNSFSDNIHIVQWYEYTGISGGTLWILLVNFTAFVIWTKVKQQNKRLFLRNMALIIILIFAPIIYSIFLFNKEYPGGEIVHVSIFQTQINPYNKHQETEIKKCNSQISKLSESIPADTKLIVLPETTISTPVHKDSISYSREIKQFEPLLQKNEKLQIISGIFTYNTTKTNEPNFKNPNWKEHAKAYNSAVIFNADTNQIYDKKILVPGIEKIPLAEYFPKLDNAMLRFGGIRGSLNSGNKTNVLKTQNNPIRYGISICWEAVFGEYTSKSARYSTQAIIIISNDGWWKQTPAKKMLMAIAQLRAIECRKYAVRATNMGISGIISPKGEIIKASDTTSQAKRIDGKIQLNIIQTDYAKTGDFIGRTALFITTLLLLYIAVQLNLRKNNNLTYL